MKDGLSPSHTSLPAEAPTEPERKPVYWLPLPGTDAESGAITFVGSDDPLALWAWYQECTTPRTRQR